MRYSIQKGNLKMNGLVEKLIQRKTDKIETLLTHYHPELIDLKIKINKLEDKGIFTVQMLLSLPSQVLRSEKESKDVVEAMGLAFDTLIREVKKFKERLRKEHTYGKV